ncbi:MAG: preprotein translocase subunit SecY [Clostridia bacterium]|nr:preprotein translocase subunit SecY [Clostridia bacterium]
MFQTLKNAWKTPELKSKLLFTLLIIVLYRLGANIPVPYINQSVMESANLFAGGSIFAYLNILSGEAFGKATLFALGVSPYITSSIVMQLLTIAIPALERLSKDGEEGRKKITAITRYVTVGLALITSIGYAMYLKTAGMVGEISAFDMIVIIACYCAGSSLVMWLAEKINEHGIGNGISMILFANIISSFPGMVASMIAMVDTTTVGSTVLGVVLFILSILLTLAMFVIIIWMTDSERRIPVQYAKRVVGRKMYGGQGTNLPLKVNMTGVMPIIFASSIVSIPATIASFFPNSGFWSSVLDVFNYNTWLYILIEFILLVLFAYFYVSISFNPVEVANNLKKQGGAVPGIRPGKPTSDYITKVLNRITLVGALILSVICILPMCINIIAGGTFASLAFGGSSIIIVVGVALETFRELEAQMSLRNYKGFLD